MSNFADWDEIRILSAFCDLRSATERRSSEPFSGQLGGP